MNRIVQLARGAYGRVSGQTEHSLRRMLHARESAIREREDVVREREATIRRYEEIIFEREESIREREGLIDKKDNDISVLFEKLKREEGRSAGRRDEKHGNVGELSNINTDSESEQFDSDAPLNKWRHDLDSFRTENYRGAQKLIEPYILERWYCGRRYRMIIGTEEGRQWYDALLPGLEVHQAQALGMIRPGDTVFDCGCNQGFHSLIYSDLVGPNGKVVAFDPYPLNMKLSRFNADLNTKSNIDFVEAGLSDRRGTAKVSISEQSTVLDNRDADDTISINLVPLDDYKDDHPDYIKIDVEGAEVDALAGAVEILKSRPSIYVEVHHHFLPRFRRRPMDIFNYVSLDDYRCFINYPNMAALTPYEMEFEITDSCGLFLVPRDRPPLVRYYSR